MVIYWPFSKWFYDSVVSYLLVSGISKHTYCKNARILSPDQILSRCTLVLQSCNEGNFEHSCPSFKGQTPYVEFLKTFSLKKRQTKLIGYGFSFFLIYRRPSFDGKFFLINWRLMKNIRFMFPTYHFWRQKYEKSLLQKNTALFKKYSQVSNTQVGCNKRAGGFFFLQTLVLLAYRRCAWPFVTDRNLVITKGN